jgi:hypothetical protein
LSDDVSPNSEFGINLWMDMWTLTVITKTGPYEEEINRVITDKALVDIGCDVRTSTSGGKIRQGDAQF